MTKKHLSTKKPTIQLIQSIFLSDLNGVQKAIASGASQRIQITSKPRLFYRNNTETTYITVQTTPVLTALREWNIKKTKEAADILRLMLESVYAPSKTFITVRIDSAYRENGVVKKEKTEYNYSVADFIRFNQNRLQNKQEYSPFLNDYYTSSHIIMDMLINHIRRARQHYNKITSQKNKTYPQSSHQHQK